MFILVAHFGEPAPADVLKLFAAQPTCDRLVFARSTDEIGRYVLVAEFADAPAYRRALSPFEVRTTVIPWLATADPGSGVNEALAIATDHRIVTQQPTVTPGR